jgi:hypothetical protein
MKKLRILLVSSLLCGGFLLAQTISAPINQPVFRAFDANGNPLAGGKLFSYAAGTSTLLATYADAARATPNSNPVILDSTGQAKVFMGLANYKFILQDANGVQQWTIDSVNGAPPPSAVTSVFGRTGAVAALSGDYSCGQITGAVCSLPTIRYQTVQANGSTQTQRSKINLISGTQITVACADNSGNDSTDCTITYVAPVATSDIWFAFDTCTIAQTGNTYQCSSTYSGSPFPLDASPSAMVCTPQTPGPVSATFNITQGSLGSSGFQYSFGQYMGNGTSGSAVGAHVFCVIHFAS